MVVKGRADLRGRELQLVALEITRPDLGLALPPPVASDPLIVDVQAASCTSGLIARLRELLRLHPGTTPVVVRLVDGQAVTRLRLDAERSVDASPALLDELRRLLGTEAVRVTIDSAPAGSALVRAR